MQNFIRLNQILCLRCFNLVISKYFSLEYDSLLQDRPNTILVAGTVRLSVTPMRCVETDKYNHVLAA